MDAVYWIAMGAVALGSFVGTIVALLFDRFIDWL